MRVLVADPSPAVAKSLVGALHALDARVRVTEVGNGKQALHALSQESYDFIITELDMPGGSGDVFIGHLKSARLLSHKPIIIYSDSDFDEAGHDHIIHIYKRTTSLQELNTIVKELVFKHFLCPRCGESIDGGPCGDICFYKALDIKWKQRVRELLK
jgi:CheY-like chemotaxis protein